VWQKKFEQYRSAGFTVVGIAMDVEGIAPAKKYYDEFGVTFPALVDPNYATRFGVVPLTFFVNEHGVVQPLEDWESRILPPDDLQPVTEEIREQFTAIGERLQPAGVEQLAAQLRSDPADLSVASELASRYMELDLREAARTILKTAVAEYDPKDMARMKESPTRTLLANAYLQLSRSETDRDRSVEYATMSYFLNPTIGFAKQISRMIAPEKFDDRPDGRFDNEFREATRRRLERERRAWLSE